MIGHRRRPDRAGYPAPAPPERCELGGLQAVLGGSDLATASVHFGHCTACQREFVRLGGLLPIPQSTPPAGRRPVSPVPVTRPARSSQR
jgi:hypothetical protein